MKNKLFVLALMAIVVAVALASSAFAQEVPPGAGCGGLKSAVVAQKENPPSQDAASAVDAQLKAHSCVPGK